MLRPRELFQDAFVQLPAGVNIARESQVEVGTGIPASREEAGSVFRIMQLYPSPVAFSVFACLFTT